MLTRIYRDNQSVLEDGIEPNDPTKIPRTYTDEMVDCKIGKDAASPETWDYYSGWAIGHRMYECQKRSIELPDDF